MIETAVVVLVLVMLTFGITEYGLMLRRSDDVADSVRSGIRAGAGGGNGVDADYEIITAMKDSADGLGGDINAIVIFEADANGNPTTACGAFTVQAGKCNVYSGADFNASKLAIRAKSVSQNGWPPTSREPSTDYIGVRARSGYSWITKFYGSGTRTLGDVAVARLEDAVEPSGEEDPFTQGSKEIPPSGNQVPKSACAVCTGGSGTGGPING